MKTLTEKINMTVAVTVLLGALALGCGTNTFRSDDESRLIPAEEFTKSARRGKISDFSIFKAAGEHHHQLGSGAPAAVDGTMLTPVAANAARSAIPGAELPGVMPKSAEKSVQPLQKEGLQLRRSIVAEPSIQPREWGQTEPLVGQQLSGSVPMHAASDTPAGSLAPYYDGQMTANPSLWPDEGQGAALFRDFRAFEAMDVITILVNENTEGKKKTNTDAKSEFSITAAISSFFGIETKDWKSNNEALDPASLINAETDTDLKAKGETKREGKLRGRLSAVIMEVLPNGLLRIEGTKIVSVDNEEETMILSGLVRQRDVDAENQVDSSRIANMRIDFYGRGILGEHTNYGWGVRLFKFIWPF